MPVFSHRCYRRLAASLLAVVLSFSLPASAVGGESNILGTLTANLKTASWQPSDGPVLEGPFDHGDLQPALRKRLAEVFAPDGLHTGGRVIPPGHLVANVVALSGSKTRISIESSGASTTGLAFWSSGHAARLDTGEVWFGDVVVFDAGLTIAGEIIGNVIALGGDVTLLPSGVIRGDVAVIGGALRQERNTKIYGRVFAPGGHRRPRLTIPRARELEERPYVWLPTVSYDRVDGLRLGIGGGIARGHDATRADLWTGYALASGTWQYRIGVRQRFLSSGLLEAWGTTYRLTATDDETTTGRNENTVFALFSGSDFRDYYGQDGVELGVAYRFREVGSLSLRYENADYRPLNAEPGLWHLFRRGGDFRQNFSTVDSVILARTPLDRRSSAFRITFKVAPVESGRHPIGFNGSLTAFYEVAGGALGGGYDYDRIAIEGLGWWDSGRAHRVRVRAFYGAGRRDLPANKLFYSGGIGTLRGFSQKVFVGNESLVGNIEYEFTYWENPFGDAAVIFFYDFGRTTFDNDFLNLDRFKSDLGVGLDFGESIRVNAAQGLDTSDGGIKVTVRLARSF